MPSTSSAIRWPTPSIFQPWFESAITAENVDLVGIGTYDGSDLDEILRGTAAPETITAAGGDDFVFAGAGNDRIIAANGAGNDRYVGGTGQDEVIYASSREGMIIDLAQAIANGGADVGRDILHEIEHVTGSDHADAIVVAKYSLTLETWRPIRS